MLSLPRSRCPLCEEVVQRITCNQHVLWASLNLEYYWCQSQGSVAIPKGCFAMSHVTPIHMGAYHWHVLLWNVRKCTFMKLKCNNCLSKSCTTLPCFTCVPGCMHVCTAHCIAGSVCIVLLAVCVLYCWQCVYCIVCLCLYVCVVWIFCVLLSRTLLLIKTMLLMQMNWYSILCLLLIWYWHFLLCNVNALSLSSLSHFHATEVQQLPIKVLYSALYCLYCMCGFNSLCIVVTLLLYNHVVIADSSRWNVQYTVMLKIMNELSYAMLPNCSSPWQDYSSHFSLHCISTE